MTAPSASHVRSRRLFLTRPLYLRIPTGAQGATPLCSRAARVILLRERQVYPVDGAAVCDGRQSSEGDVRGRAEEDKGLGMLEADKDEAGFVMYVSS